MTKNNAESNVFNPLETATEPTEAAQSTLETVGDVIEGGLNLLDLLFSILSCF